jgi:hypothetical protein
VQEYVGTGAHHKVIQKTWVSGLHGLLPKAVFFNEFQKNMQPEFKKFQIGLKDKNIWE